MRSRDENYLTMVRNVIAVLDRHELVWQQVKIYTSYVTDLKAFTADTFKHQVLAELDSKGYTENKHIAEQQAVDMALDLSKRALSFASDTKQMDLYEQLNITKYGLLTQHDNQILSKLNDIYINLKKQESNLLPYGIQPNELTMFREAIDKYDHLLDDPREKIVERKGYNTAANNNMPRIKELIEKMDNLMGNFKDTPFAVDYKNARIVIDNSSREEDKGSNETTMK